MFAPSYSDVLSLARMWHVLCHGDELLIYIYIFIFATGNQLSTTEKMVMTVAEIVAVLIDSHSQEKEVNLNKCVCIVAMLLASFLYGCPLPHSIVNVV